MSTAARGGALPWAIMAMELSLVFPLGAALLGGQEPGAAGRTAAGLLLLPLGYLAAASGRLPAAIQGRLALGAAVSLGLRLAVTWPAEPLALAVLGHWTSRALWPAALGLALAWRGAWLAETDSTAEGVRSEFAIIGGVLLLALGIYANTLGLDLATRALMVLLYLSAGLVAVGLARQAAAGAPASPGGQALVAACAALLLLLSAGLAALLSPALISAILTMAQEVLLAVLRVALLPLMWLLAGLQLELPDQPSQTINTPPARPEGSLADALPPWLLQALGIGLIVVAVLVAILVAVALIWLLWEMLGRLGHRPGLRRPMAVDRDGGPREALAGLLSALRRWLGGVAAPRFGGEALVDARACYRALLRWARGRGVERAPAETPAELRARLEAAVPGGAAQVDQLTAAYERARYGGLPLAAAELARLRQHLQALAALPAEPPPERAP